MALRQIMLAKKIEQRKALLGELTEQEKQLQTRSQELEASIEEAQTDEEIEAVEEEINKLDVEKQEHDDKKSKLEGEIAQLEGELEQLNSNAPINTRSSNQSRTQIHVGGEERMKVNKFETRSQMLDRLNQTEVREFYATIAAAVKDQRSLSGAEITIPDQVINMIQTRLGDFSALYQEVTVESLNGTARVIMDGAIPEAIWTEMCDPVQELASAFSRTELDGFKVGGFIPVCNALLEDSMINLANFVEQRLAMAIAKSLDKAILIGEGSAQKQPEGVITSIAANLPAHQVTSDRALPNIVSKMSLIDDGEDGPPIGEVIAVMKRSFYYSVIAPQTFLPTSDGRLVIQNAQNPRLPDGTRIVFSQYTPDNTIVLGDFKKYLLGERRGVQLTVSTDVRFIQDQTVFKGTARYDGKPIYPNYFVVITIDDNDDGGDGEQGE